MVLTIVKYGHPALRQKGARIESITPEIKQLIADMFETMYEAKGVGLAATQVDVHERFQIMLMMFGGHADPYDRHAKCASRTSKRLILTPAARLDYAHDLRHEDRAMADEQQEKTPLEKLRTVVSQLKDIEHHARNNLERLSEIWLLLEEDFKKKKALAERVNDLLKAEGAMEDLLKAVIQEFDKECADMQKP